MKTIKRLAICVLLLLLITSVNAQVVLIRDIKCSVPSPGCLSHGDKIDVTFRYASKSKEGVRIFVRPLSNGQLTPNYAAEGSGLYPEGNGSGSGWFTITSGDVLVSHVRVQAVSKSGDVLYTQFKEVQYLFLTKLASKENSDSISNKSIVIDRNILPNGDVEISYSDMSRKRISEGVSVIIKPDGSEQSKMVPYIAVQPNIPPQLPDDSKLRDWLEIQNENLLNTILILVGNNEDAVKSYLQNESEKTRDLFEKIGLRIECINLLLNEQKK